MSRDVYNMFSDIAPRYDIANDVLSFGTHRWWRKRAVEFARVQESARVLDICSGTGDFAFCLAGRLGSEGEVVGVDFVETMLNIAEQKRQQMVLDETNGSAEVSFVQGDALHLPFPANTFDLVTVAFGIRNVDDTLSCLKEMRRVLREEGRVLILEFGVPRLPVFSQMYRFYSSYLMPSIGGILTGDRRAYEYLPRTAQEYPCGDNFTRLMGEAGFRTTKLKHFLSGVAFAYTGVTH